MSTSTGVFTDRELPPHPFTNAGYLSAIGAASVVITSAFYVLSPPAAAGPVQPLDLFAAMSGAKLGAVTLHAAGTVGIFGDIIWAIAALLIAQELGRRGRTIASAGWLALFLSIVLFVFVDGMTAAVLPQLASSGDAAVFEGFKHLWDMLFLLGTVAYGGGVVVALGAELSDPMLAIKRPLAVVTLVIAFIGGLAATMGLTVITGLPIDKIAGASIGLGSILFVPVSLQIARAKST